jgi:hypothetical protein
MAIALDTVATTPYSAPATWPHTCGATASVLFVYIRCDAGNVTGVTYAGVAMTLATSVVSPGPTTYYLYVLAAPTIGTNTVAVATASSFGAASASYTGSSKASNPLEFPISFQPSGNFAAQTTTDKCWAVWGAGDRTGSNPTAVSNCIARATPGGGSSITLFDSNGPITPPTSSFLMTSSAQTSTAGVVGASLKPPGSAGRMFEVF